MSSATMDVPIDQLRALPLERRLEILDALLESVQDEAGSFPVSDEFGDDPDERYGADVHAPGSTVPWERVRDHIRRYLERSKMRGAPRDVRLSEGEQAEFDRGLAEHRRNPAAAQPVDAFLDELDRRYL